MRRSPDKSAEERLQENLEFYDIFSKTNDLKKDLLKVRNQKNSLVYKNFKNKYNQIITIIKYNYVNQFE